MKIIKVMAGIVALAAIILTGIIFFVANNLNGFIEEIIEDTGTEMTQTRVDVGSVDLQLTEGVGAIYKLSIANPQGYSSNKLFQANAIALQVDLRSVSKPVKIIKQINVGEIRLNAEQKNIKDTNIQALLDNIKKSSSGSSKPASGAKEDVRIMIQKLNFAAATIDLQTEKLGGRSISLPAFTITNIGDRKNGVTPEQAGQQITKQLMSKVRSAVASELKNILKVEAAGKVTEKIKDELKDSISKDKLKSLFK